MNKPLEGCLMCVCALVALVVGFWVVFFDIPVFFGLTIIDARDPDRPGGLKALTVSPYAFLLHIALVVGCVYVFARLWRGRRANDSLTS